MDLCPPATHRVDTGSDGGPVLVKRATDGGGRVRLSTEAAVLRALGHPGTVRVTALVEGDDATELHLAWVGPHSLATVTGLPPAASAALVAQVADVVADLHRAGVAHRRLSSDHVLVGTEGRPVLTGLAAAGRADPAATAADVAALGALLTDLASPTGDGLDLPERRRPLRRIERALRGDRALRGALLTIADRAQADDPAARPTAAELATLLRTAAGLPSPPPAAHDTGTRSVDATGPTTRPFPAWEAVEEAAGDGVLGTTPGRSRNGRRRSAGAIRRPVVAGVALVGALLGLVALASTVGGPGRGTSIDAQPAAVTSGPPGPDTPRQPDASTPRPSVGPRGSDPEVAPDERDPGCPEVGGGAADIDGDGCPEVVRVAGQRVSAAGTTWRVGRAGDRVTVGDWDCDGRATVALLRPATGEVFVYRGWATRSSPLTVEPLGHAPGADALAPRDPDGDGCADLVATGPRGRAVTIELGSGP